jgi:hypothetical protein
MTKILYTFCDTFEGFIMLIFCKKYKIVNWNGWDVSRYIYIYKLNDKTEKIYDGQVFIGHSWSCIKKGWNVVTNWQQVILILSLKIKWLKYYIHFVTLLKDS